MHKPFVVLAATVLLSGCGADEGAYLTEVREGELDADYAMLTEWEWIEVGKDACLKMEAGIDYPDELQHPSGAYWATFWFAAKDHLC